MNYILYIIYNGLRTIRPPEIGRNPILRWTSYVVYTNYKLFNTLVDIKKLYILYIIVIHSITDIYEYIRFYYKKLIKPLKVCNAHVSHT